MRTTVLIDGPSGAGKTTFAAKLSARTGWPVVHMDDVYPGWGGLAAGASRVVTDLLHPTSPGYRRWDWFKNAYAEWVALDPSASLIIEGVGAITEQSVAAAKKIGEVRTIRVEADRDKRKARALERDPGYEEFWDMWAAQENAHFCRNGAVRVDQVVRT